MSAVQWAVAALVVLLAVWIIRAGRRAARAEWGHAWLNVLDGINRILCRRYHRLHGDEIPLPDLGPAVVVSNHLSGLDPLLLIAASRRPLRFLIAREQYDRFGLRWLYRAVGGIPVDRDRNPRLAVRMALRALMAGEVVALFPEGRIQTPDMPRRPLRSGVMRLAQFTGAPIYPVRLSGIRGAGKTVLAVIPRSRARLDALPPMDPEEFRTDHGLDHLAELLHGVPLERPPAAPMSEVARQLMSD